MNKENTQFKILYVIAILSVLTIHIGNSQVLPVFNFISLPSVIIALFGFISGYFYKSESEEGILKYIKKKILKLLLPFFLWNLFYGILTFILKSNGLINFGGELSLKTLVLMPLYNTHEFRFNLASWFIVPLFISEIYNIIIRKILPKGRYKNIFVFGTALLLLFYSVYLANNDQTIKSTFDSWNYLFYRTCYILCFYEFGILYKDKLEPKIDKINNLIYFLVVIIIQIVLIMYFKEAKSYAIVWAQYKGDLFFLPFIVALPGIFFFLRISKLLVPVLKESKVVKLIHKYGYSIMVNQFLGTFILSSIFAIISVITHHFQSFDWLKYKNDVYYFFIPRNAEAIRFVYFIFAIIISIVLGKLVSTISKKMMELFKKMIKRKQTETIKE